jgi:tetratricopeptide (TPR) repeat protein
MYRRLAEPAAQRSKDAIKLRMWSDCMDRWAEELGVREKMRVSLVVTHHFIHTIQASLCHLQNPLVNDNNLTPQGNMLVNNSRHQEAVEYYTRALALDPKKTIYLSNRAVALNTLGEHERAEADCTYILSKDGKNGKAFFQRALARRGLGKVREAEADLREVLRHQPGNESAKKLMSVVKGEVARLPKLSAKEAMEF